MILFRIDEAQDMVVVRVLGDVSVKDACDAVHRIVCTDAWHPEIKAMVDLRDLARTVSMVGFTDVVNTMMSVGVRNAEHAFITKGGFIGAVTGLWCTTASILGITHGSFSSVGEACDWLGVDEGKTQVMLVQLSEK